MDTKNETTEPQEVLVLVTEQPSVKEQAVAALVVTGVTLAGTALMYAVGYGVTFGVAKLAEANDNRKARKAAKRAAKEAQQES